MFKFDFDLEDADDSLDLAQLVGDGNIQANDETTESLQQFSEVSMSKLVRKSFVVECAADNLFLFGRE